MSQSKNEGDNAHEVQEAMFNTDVDVEAELEEMKRQVDSLQEDLQLKTLQDTAAKEEGTRKTATAGPTGNSGAAQGGSKSGTSVFVNGLDARTTDADLRVFFSGCGTIDRLTLLKDRYTGQPKGTAYIEFATQEQAQAALLKDGQSLHGKPLKVAPKRDNIPAFQRGMGRAGAGGFYGRGRGGPMANLPPQMAAVAMMASMMAGGTGFSPYGAPRGRGGRGRGGRGGSGGPH